MIGIMGAMEEEVSEIKKYMNVDSQNTIEGYTFYEGTMSNQKIILVQGGIGKVNAAISTTLLLSHYQIDFLINVGSAGGLSLSQNVGDIVISTGVLHHDVDVTAFQRPLGQVPGMPLIFEPDCHALNKIKDILQEFDQPYHMGLIVSGDQFISRKDQVKKIKKDFPEAICAEMEAAAIAQVCHVFQIPFIITRSLSDIYQKGENHVQFDEYLKKASQASAKMCYQFISTLSQ